MIIKYNATVVSPDGDTWSGEITDHALPRSGELLTIVNSHERGMTLPPPMKGIVSSLEWRWHNGVAHVKILLMAVPEKHVTKVRSEEPNTKRSPVAVLEKIEKIAYEASDWQKKCKGADMHNFFASIIQECRRGVKAARPLSPQGPNPCAEIHLPGAGGNLPTEEIERLKAEVYEAELRLSQHDPISAAVNKARELASSNPVLELEVLLMTDVNLDITAKALLRRVIRALKESKCYG